MRSFAEFAPAGSTVSIISQQNPSGHLPKRLGNVSRFDFVQHAHPTSLEVGAKARERRAQLLARRSKPWGVTGVAGGCTQGAAEVVIWTHSLPFLARCLGVLPESISMYSHPASVTRLCRKLQVAVAQQPNTVP